MKSDSVCRVFSLLLWLSHKRNVTLCLKRSINWAYNMQANSESLSWLASFGETTMTRKHGGSKLFWTLGSMPEDNRYVDNRFHHQQQQHSHTHGIKRLVRFSQNHKKFEIWLCFAYVIKFLMLIWEMTFVFHKSKQA